MKDIRSADAQSQAFGAATAAVVSAAVSVSAAAALAVVSAVGPAAAAVAAQHLVYSKHHLPVYAAPPKIPCTAQAAFYVSMVSNSTHNAS